MFLILSPLIHLEKNWERGCKTPVVPFAPNEQTYQIICLLTILYLHLEVVCSLAIVAQSHWDSNTKVWFLSKMWLIKEEYFNRSNFPFFLVTINQLEKYISVYLIAFQTLWKKNSLCAFYVPLHFENLPLSDLFIPQNFCNPSWSGVYIFWNHNIKIYFHLTRKANAKVDLKHNGCNAFWFVVITAQVLHLKNRPVLPSWNNSEDTS